MKNIKFGSSKGKFTKTVAGLNGWDSIPPIGNIESYMSVVMRLPMLELAEEVELGRSLRDSGDTEASKKLTLSHLKLVVTIARQHMGYGLPLADLVGEGNIGLMKAVKGFNPDHGVRLSSYATYWIKAEINEFILKNAQVVKLATTKNQRKLFFNLRHMKQKMQSCDSGECPGAYRTSMTPSQVSMIAKSLNVKEHEVVEMEVRLNGGDISLEHAVDDDGEEYVGPIAYLSDDSYEPSNIIASQRRSSLATDGVIKAIQTLDDRSRKIIEERWINVDDTGCSGKTLHELASELGVTAERVRQIESAAMKKLRVTMSAYVA